MNASRRGILTAAIVAAPLGACASLSAGSASLDTEKALYVAELAYNGFASSVVALRPTGSTLATLKDIDNKAYMALQLVRAGKGAAQAVLDALASASGILPAAAPAPVARAFFNHLPVDA